jgi:putative flippase GtrA
VTDIFRFFWTPQFPRFVVFSGIAALTNLGVGYLLYQSAGLNQRWQYGLSVSVAFLAGMAVSFILNRSFTFDPSGRPVQHEMRTFFIVSLGGLVLTVALTYLFRAAVIAALVVLPSLAARTPAAVTPDVIGHFTAVGCVGFYSFACHKLFSFGKRVHVHSPSGSAAERSLLHDGVGEV